MNQFVPFVISIFSGAGIGCTFDLLRLHRKKFNVSTFFLNFQDIFFWLFFAFAVCYFTFYVNNGVFRAYEFIGFGLGIFLYMKFLSRIFQKVFTIIWKIFAFIAFWLLKIIFFPVILLMPLAKPIKKLFKYQKSQFITNAQRLKRFAKRI